MKKLLFIAMILVTVTGVAQEKSGYSPEEKKLLIEALQIYDDLKDEFVRYQRADSIITSFYIAGRDSFMFVQKVKEKETFNKMRNVKGKQMLFVEEMFQTMPAIKKPYPPTHEGLIIFRENLRKILKE